MEMEVPAMFGLKPGKPIQADAYESEGDVKSIVDRMHLKDEDKAEFLDIYRHWRKTETGIIEQHNASHVSLLTSEDVELYNELPPPEHEYHQVKHLLSKVAVWRVLPITGAGADPQLPLLLKQLGALNSYYGCNIPLYLSTPWNRCDSAAKLIENEKYNFEVKIVAQAMLPVLDYNTHLPLSVTRYRATHFYSLSSGSIFVCTRNASYITDLLKEGKKHLFIANSTRRLPVLDIRVLQHVKKEKKDFVLEVSTKGEDVDVAGVLVKQNGVLTLLDRTPSDLQENNSYSLLNTNNMWIDMRELRKHKENKINLKLKPVRYTIENKSVVALTIAEAGHAIEFFQNAAAVQVNSDCRKIERTEDFSLNDWFLDKLARVMFPKKQSKVSVMWDLLVFFVSYHILVGAMDIMMDIYLKDDIAREWAKGGCWLGVLAGYLIVLAYRRHKRIKSRNHMEYVRLKDVAEVHNKLAARPRDYIRAQDSDAWHLFLAGVVRYLCNGISKTCETNEWLKNHVYVVTLIAHTIGLLLEIVGCFVIEYYVGDGFREPIETY